MGVRNSLLCENGNSGTYWSNLSTVGRSRYGDPGGERVFGHLKDWRTFVDSYGQYDVYDVCEIGEAFVDACNPILNVSVSGGCMITPSVNGVITSAFHGGVIGGGYIYYAQDSSDGGSNTAVLNLQKYSRLEGIDIMVESGGYNRGGCAAVQGGSIDRCIIRRDIPSTGTANYGYSSSAYAVISNCIIKDFDRGVYLARYNYGGRLVNNLITKNLIGIDLQYDATAIYESFANTISVGNGAENWGTLQPTLGYALNNAGEAGDAPFDTGTATAITIDTSVDFVDFTNNDFRPTAGSALVDGGISVYGIDSSDLSKDVRPNYDPTGTEAWDVGPYEYDHGHGLAPISVDISITGIATGSELAIYGTSDDSEIVAPQTMSGGYSSTYTYTGDVDIEVKIRSGSSSPKYLPYSYLGTITDSGFALSVAQVEDTIAS